MMSDIARLKRRVYILIAYSLIMILIGIGVMTEGSTGAVIAGGVFTLLLGVIPLVIGLKGLKKSPPEPAYFLGSDKRNFAVLGTFYWFNDKGIWKNDKLIATWSDIKDIQIVRTWIETRTRARTGTALDIVLNQGPDALQYGTVKVFLKDGASFEINYAVDPQNQINFIKNTYLKRT